MPQLNPSSDTKPMVPALRFSEQISAYEGEDLLLDHRRFPPELDEAFHIVSPHPIVVTTPKHGSPSEAKVVGFNPRTATCILRLPQGSHLVVSRAHVEQSLGKKLSFAAADKPNPEPGTHEESKVLFKSPVEQAIERGTFSEEVARTAASIPTQIKKGLRIALSVLPGAKTSAPSPNPVVADVKAE